MSVEEKLNQANGAIKEGVGKVTDDKIEAKANELQKIIQSLEEKEERWFELSSKME